MKTTAALTAKAIKSELKAAFPSIKFKVTSDTFSGGDAVRIGYADGVPTSEVEAIVKKYQYGHFNGMEDIYENSNSIEGLPQVKYVQVGRTMSEEIAAAILKEFQTKFAGYENLTLEDYAPQHQAWMSSAIRSEFSKRNYLTVLNAAA